MKHILTIAAVLLVIIVALNLFNNGHVSGAFLLAIAAVSAPIYLHFRKGNNKDEKS